MSPTGITEDGKKRQVDLQHAVRMVEAGIWPTPSVSGNYNRAGASPKSGDGLATAVARFPTPSAASATQGQNEPDGRRGQTLVGAARGQAWPTPVADDTELREVAYAQGGIPLSLAARTWPTPNATDGDKAPKTFARGNPSLPQAVKDAEGGGSLNPTWVEWLMGFPAGWTDLEDSGTP
jgi:hypothetical protein